MKKPVEIDDEDVEKPVEAESAAPGFGVKSGAPKPAPPAESEEPEAPEATDPDEGAEPVAEGEEQQGEPASPEEQEQFDLLVAQAMNTIADPKNKAIRDKVVGMMQAGDDPIEAMATAAFYMFQAAVDGGEKAGFKFDNPDVLFNAGLQIVEVLADFAESKKIGTYSEDDREAIYLRAVDIYRERNKSKLNPQVAQQEMAELAQADREGRLDQLVPGIDKVAAKMKANMEKGAPAPVEGEEPEAAAEPEEQEV